MPTTAADRAEQYGEDVTGMSVEPMVVAVRVTEPVPTEPQPPASFATAVHALAPSTGTVPNAVAYPVLVAGFLAQRTRCLVQNTGSAVAYVSTDAALATATTGYPLQPAASMELRTAAEVWAMAPAGTTLAVLSEFTRQ